MNLTPSADDQPHSERSIEEFNQLSGKGDSRGWRFDRDEIHSRADIGVERAS